MQVLVPMAHHGTITLTLITGIMGLIMGPITLITLIIVVITPLLPPPPYIIHVREV